MAETERQSDAYEKLFESFDSDEKITDMFDEQKEMFELFTRKHMMLLILVFTKAETSIRFNELQNATDIPRTTLSNRLSELVEEGLVARRAYNEIPPRVEYEATESIRELRELNPAFEALFSWWSDHKER